MYTMIPNGLIEAMPTMKNSTFAVCMAVCRKTLGHHRLWDKISISQFVQLTGMSNRSIIDAVEAAVAAGWISRKRDGDSYQYKVAGADEILNSEKSSHNHDENTNKNASLMCEESSQGDRAGSEKISQGYEVFSQGGCEIFSHTKENISLTNVSVPEAPQTLALRIRDLLERLERAKPNQRQPILLEAYQFCFGQNGDTPSYSYLGKAAKGVGGAGHLVEIMCSLAARPPTGDKLAYIMATHKSKTARANGKPPEVDLLYLLNQGENA